MTGAAAKLPTVRMRQPSLAPRQDGAMADLLDLRRQLVEAHVKLSDLRREYKILAERLAERDRQVQDFADRQTAALVDIAQAMARLEGADLPPPAPTVGASSILRGNARLMEVTRLVAGAHGVPSMDIRGQSRIRAVVLARQEVMYLAHEVDGFDLTTIGRFLGGRDHSTVRHGIEAEAARRAARADSGGSCHGE